jgi:translation initiation factor 2A
MDAVWGTGPQVQIIHPGSNCIAGRESVMESWKTLLAGVRPRAFRIELEDVRIHATESYGFVTCVEIVDADESAGRLGSQLC